MGYRIGSEDWFFQESKSLGPIQNAEIKMPRGMRHAIAPGQETAVCGYPEVLYIYAAWDSPGFMRASERCEECKAFVEAHPA